MIVFSTCWQPQDTGFGDDSASIVNYRIESSICPSFSLEESCAYHNLLLQAGLETSYALNLTGEILPIAGRVYYIRVSAENEATRGASRLLMLPFVMTVQNQDVSLASEDELLVKWDLILPLQLGSSYILRVANASGGLSFFESAYAVDDTECIQVEGRCSVNLPLNFMDSSTTTLLTVSVVYQLFDGTLGPVSSKQIPIIGPPSAPLILDQILQTSEKWSVHWTRPSIFWTEAHAQPVGYLVQIWCGGESMELIYNDSASVQSPVFVSNFSADWGYAGSLRALTLVPEDVEAVVVTQPALICQQGQKINVSVTARNRAFKSPTAVITQKLAAPPSEVGGLRFVEYTGGVTLFWEQVRVSLIIMYCMQVLLC